MAHLDFENGAGVTVRYDSFDDKDGWVFPAAGGMNQKMQSFTFSPSYSLDEGLGTLIEVRLDKSDQDGFVDKDGAPTDSNLSVAFEMTYGW